MRKLTLLLAALAFAAAACSDDHKNAATTTSLAASPTSTTTTADACGTPGGATTTLLPAAGTTAVSTPSTSARWLTAVRVACHGGAGGTFTRVAFEFENGIPGYSVSYASRPILEDASGKTVDVKGDAVLRVRMESASGTDITGAAARTTYTGPARIAGPGSSVQEIVLTGDFESVLTWVIGVKGQPPFHVYPTGANVLTIDIAE
jgi:hypothetical protein